MLVTLTKGGLPGFLKTAALPAVTTGLEAVESNQPQTGDAQSSTPAVASVRDNFAASLFKNLQKDQEGDNDRIQAAAGLTADIGDAINELEKQFGAEAANEARAAVLRATTGQLSSEKIAGAITGVLQGLAAKANSTLQTDQLAADDYQAAEETQKKLTGFLDYLNNGSAGATNGSSLSQSLNSFFGTGGAGGNIFNLNLKWGPLENEEAAAPGLGRDSSATGEALTSQVITVDDIGREKLADFISYLRNDLGTEKEADYFESLSGEANFLAEVENLSNRLFNSSPLEQVKTDWGTVLQRRGEGYDQAQKLSGYMSHELTDLVNAAISGDEKLRNRLAGEINHSDEMGDWQFQGWKQSGQLNIHNNNWGGEASWETRRSDLTRCQARQNSIEARAFAKDEMIRLGTWQEGYEKNGEISSAGLIKMDELLVGLRDQGLYFGGYAADGELIPSQEERQRKLREIQQLSGGLVNRKA